MGKVARTVGDNVPLSFATWAGKPVTGFRVARRRWRQFAQVIYCPMAFLHPGAFFVTNLLGSPNPSWMSALACYRQLKFEMPSVRQSAAH
jgi:hypothetical protein